MQLTAAVNKSGVPHFVQGVGFYVGSADDTQSVVPHQSSRPSVTEQQKENK